MRLRREELDRLIMLDLEDQEVRTGPRTGISIEDLLNWLFVNPLFIRIRGLIYRLMRLSRRHNRYFHGTPEIFSVFRFN